MDKYELIARVALGLQLAWSDCKDTWDLVEGQDLSLPSLTEALRLLRIPPGDTCLSLGLMRDIVSHLYPKDYDGDCPECGGADLEVTTPLAA